MNVSPQHRPSHIALVAFPGVRAFDVSVITEVWGVDRTDRGVPAFDLRRVAADPAPVPLRGGLSLTPDRTLAWLDRADLIVVPGLDDHLTPAPEPVLEALRSAHSRGTPSPRSAEERSPSPRRDSWTAAAPSPTGISPSSSAPTTPG